jgi:hypothetical protein
MTSHGALRISTAAPSETPINYADTGFLSSSDLQSLVDVPGENGLCLAVLLLANELQASAYCALMGFYRQGIAVLRFGLEVVVAGAYFRAFPDPEKFMAWADGHEEGALWMGKVRKALRGTDPYAPFESGTETGTLFSKKGWIDFLYRRLSAFSHGRPFFTD